jgi:iron complex transport system substrate-binding protein
MKTIISTAIFLLIFLSTSTLASAYPIPGDADGDRIISEAELTDSILDYLDFAYLGGSGSVLDLEDLRESAHIHLYYPRTILCANGKDVTIYKPANRIIPLTSDGTEVIRSLGAGQSVVGISTDLAEDALFEEFASLPTIGKWNNPDCEMIIALNPDIVLAYGKWPSVEKLENKLERTGITVLRLNFYVPENMTEEVEKLGYILEKDEESEELIGFYQHYMDLIDERLKGVSEKPDVYIEGYSDYKTVSSGTGGDQMCVAAGGRNIAANLTGSYPKIDSEWLIAVNPDVMVKSAKDSYENVTEPAIVLSEIASRPGWKYMRAVKNDRVYLLTSDIYTGPRYFVGVAYMAQWFYPDRFADLDPDAIHREYMERFQGVDVQDRVFVYPN